MCKRLTLFLATNFVVVLTLSLIMSVLGIEPYISSYGLSTTHLAIFCAVWGMGGAFISLMICKITAKWSYKVETVYESSTDAQSQFLVRTVHDLGRRANLPAMPEVGIYLDDEPNAFATGPTKSNTLVAVSSGLLQSMNKDQLTAVLAHEISHIANDDMVTMTLLNGVVDSFVLFLSRVIAYAVTIGKEDNDLWNSRIAYALVRFTLEIVFATVGMLIICWFSRQREYRADAGGAALAGRQNMASSLQVLATRNSAEQQAHRRNAPIPALMISGADAGILKLWATHPPIEDRINRLYDHDDPSHPVSSLPTRDSSTRRSSNSLRDRFSQGDENRNH